MPSIRHLKNAPITEALLDIRVRAKAGFSSSNFADLPSPLSADFPKRAEYKATKVEMQIPASTPPEIQELGLQGIFYKSDDEKYVAQFRIDGFTLNRLKPYTSWEDFSSHAQALWEVYVEQAQPELVTRLALRYINHLPLPKDASALADFMQVPPYLPPELPQGVSAFYWRVTTEDLDRGISAHITQSLQRSEQDVILLVDIDAFRSMDCTPRDSSIFETLDLLRRFKNTIFFNLLTEETVRRFE